MRRHPQPYAALVGAVLLAIAFAGCGIAAGPFVSPLLCLATDFPTSGPNAALGTSEQNAVDLAVSQAALTGGYTLTTLHYGSSGVAQGQANMTDAVSQACTLAFIGPSDDAVAAAEMPIAINAGLPMLAPSLTDPGLTNASDTRHAGFDFSAMHPAGKPASFFRLLAPDDAQAAVAAETMLQAGIKRIYIVDDGQPYGLGVGDYFATALTLHGGSVAGRTSTPATTSDAFAPTVAAIAATTADGVFFAGSTSGAAALRQVLPAALPLLIISASSPDPMFLHAADSASEGTLTVSALPDVASLQGAASTQFVASYTRRFGGAPTPQAVSAYDAAELAINAIHTTIARGNLPYRASVLAQISNQSYTGIAGSYWFSGAGDNVLAAPVTIYRVHSGRWEVVQHRQP